MDKPKRKTHGAHREVAKDLRLRVAMMLRKGQSLWAIRHEIMADPRCTDAEKQEILKSLHMEDRT